jgi:hypothetical protein
MTFSVSKSGTKESVLDAVANDSVPQEVEVLVRKALDTYTDPKAMFRVTVFGHLNQPGYNGGSSINIEVVKTNELHPSFHNQDAAPNPDTVTNQPATAKPVK